MTRKQRPSRAWLAHRSAWRRRPPGSTVRRRGLPEGLEASRSAVIVFDQDARVSAVTSAGEALFNDSFGVKDGRLLALDSDDAAAPDRMLDLARSRLAYAQRHSLLVRGRGHARPAPVNVSRIARSGLDALPGARLPLVLTEMGGRDRVLAADLCRLFLLTPAEADVVVQFTEGRSIPQIARAAALSKRPFASR